MGHKPVPVPSVSSMRVTTGHSSDGGSASDRSALLSDEENNPGANWWADEATSNSNGGASEPEPGPGGSASACDPQVVVSPVTDMDMEMGMDMNMDLGSSDGLMTGSGSDIESCGSSWSFPLSCGSSIRMPSSEPFSPARQLPARVSVSESESEYESESVPTPSTRRGLDKGLVRRKCPPPPPSIGGKTARSSSEGNKIGGKRRGEEETLGADKISKKPKNVQNKNGSGPQQSNSQNGIPSSQVSPELRLSFEEEKNRIQWLSYPKFSVRQNKGSSANTDSEITYNNLILGRTISRVDAQLRQIVQTSDFCNPKVLEKLQNLKVKQYDEKNEQQFKELRLKMNGFESPGGNGKASMGFRNGGALRMANIDALIGNQLSNPRNVRGEPLLKPNELLFFVDVYGAPGGATEYLLWKKKWHAHGMGFTSKATDWDLPLMPHYPRESFDSNYGFYGKEGQGDICNPDQVEFFIKRVKKSTAGLGAHVCIAQGGNINIGADDRAEERYKYIFLSEILIGLSTVREGGHFLIKMFEILTPFTVGLVYLLYRTFQAVAIYKPETCFPGSSERYILCKHRRADRAAEGISFPGVAKYLMDCLSVFSNSQKAMKAGGDEIAYIEEIVPMATLKKDKGFCNYIVNVNAIIGNHQIRDTEELTVCLQYGQEYMGGAISRNLQGIWMKAQALWGISSNLNSNNLCTKGNFSEKDSPEIRFRKLVGGPCDIDSILKDGEQSMDLRMMNQELIAPEQFSWHFTFVGRERGFFLSLGGEKVYRYDHWTDPTDSASKWHLLADIVELAENTIVYADMVEEIQVFENEQKVQVGFHIIDGLVLGGKDIKNLPYIERWELCDKFARSMKKAARDDVAMVRVKVQHPLHDIKSCLAQMSKETLLWGGGRPSKGVVYPIRPLTRTVAGARNEGKHATHKIFKPSGLSMFRTSKGGGVAGNFVFCLQNRLLWQFTEDVDLSLDPPKFTEEEEEKDTADGAGPIHARTLIDFLKNAWSNLH